VALSVFTLGFTVLHVVVLATDRYAGVGWWGAFVPMGASYRPAAVTLGIVGVDLALLVGLSAAVAGRLPRRAWWPLHKIAVLALVVIWAHGVLAGGDTPALLGLYLATGLLVLAVAISRYAARTPAEAVENLE
jgi:DMSO/TMAO reductase YedYZ heme-binding membrane subunit